jgi:hypothetical protein
MPDPAVQATMETTFREIPFLAAARGFSADWVAGLSQISPDDLRAGAFLSQLIAAWPSPDQMNEALSLYHCAAQIVDQMIASEPNFPKTSDLRDGLDKAAETLGMSLADIQQMVQEGSSIADALAHFRPGGTSWFVPATLAMAEVGAPSINSVFSTSGLVHGTDTVDNIRLADQAGEGFLQSRVLLPGEAGTPAASLVPFEYRLDLSGVTAGATSRGVNSLVIEFGPIEKVNYTRNPADIMQSAYVVTSGAMGRVGPSRISQAGPAVFIHFDPPVMPGESSFFIGLCSRSPARSLIASVADTSQNSYQVRVQAPG